MPETPTPAEPSISDQLRVAVKADGRSCFSLGYHACRPQLDPSLISRFVRGKRTLTLRSADSLAQVLGLRLMPMPEEARETSRAVAPPHDRD